jgi:hypothetical protein
MALSFNRKKENTLLIGNQHARDDLWQRLGEKGKAPSLEKMLGTALYEGENTLFGHTKRTFFQGKNAWSAIRAIFLALCS